MAKLRTKIKQVQLARIKAKMQREFKRVVTDDFVSEQGEKVKGNMQKTVRVLGKGIDEDGKRYPLPGLADSTIDSREYYESDLSDDTKPERSNLTSTGQLLDALVNISKDGSIVIALDENRTFELGGRAPQVTNEDLKDYLEEKGFVFFNIPTSEINRIRRELRQILLKKFKL